MAQRSDPPTGTISLRALGALHLNAADGHAIQSVLTQPKRAALLVHLALATAGGGFVRRDSLLALFWPETDDEHARKALRQALYYLRRSLGEGAIVSRGDDEVGVDPGRLCCDAVEFERALEDGRAEEALESYGGDLLEGMFVADAPDFERWLSLERARLRERAGSAARALAEGAWARGRMEEVVRWGRRAVELSPGDERAIRLLIQGLAASGDRAGCSRVFEEASRYLREELLMEPSAALRELMEQIRAGEIRGESPPAAAPGLPPTAPPAPPPTAAPPPDAPGTRALRPARRSNAGAVALLAFTCVLLLAWASLRQTPAQGSPAGADAVAVLPFRVSGAAPSLGYLQEGMVDLVAAKLTGDGVPRAIDPRSMMSRWHRTAPGARDLPRAHALEMARDLQAGRVLLGSIVGTPSHLVLTASLVSAADGKTEAEAVVQGASDSLPVLVDRLLAALLSRAAGEGEDRVYRLGNTPLSALKSYLRGQAAYRHGRLEESVRHHQDALSVDSTFGLAGLGLASAAVASAGLWNGGDAHQQAIPRAWALRDRLSPRDQAFLRAIAGPGYPQRSSQAEHLRAWEQAVELAPDRPEGWNELGDLYFHAGSLLGIPDARKRAAIAFQRALDLDSSFSAPLQHMLDLAVFGGDSASARRFATLYLARNPRGDAAEAVRWRMASALGDTALVRASRSRFRAMGIRGLLRILSTGQQDPRWLHDAVLAAEALRARHGTRGERWRVLLDLQAYEQNRGRPQRAAQLAQGMVELQPEPHMHLRKLVADALYSTGSRAAAERAVRVLEASAASAASGSGDRQIRLRDLCMVEQWKLWNGATGSAQRSIERLQRANAPGDHELAVAESRSCALLLRAIAAGGDDARERLGELEALVLTGPIFQPNGTYLDLAVARLHARRSDWGAALRAVRRRWDSPEYLSAALYHEARFAKLAGDTAGSVRAYRHLLSLWSGAEPSMAPRVQEIRRELARLDQLN